VRTTLTLDDDVAAALERMRRERNASLKALVNQALREGLQRMREPARGRETFRTRAVSLGRLRLGTIDNIAEALSIAEGDALK